MAGQAKRAIPLQGPTVMFHEEPQAGQENPNAEHDPWLFRNARKTCPYRAAQGFDDK